MAHAVGTIGRDPAEHAYPPAPVSRMTMDCDVAPSSSAPTPAALEGMRPGQIRHMYKALSRRDLPPQQRRTEQLNDRTTQPNVIDLRVSQPELGLECRPLRLPLPESCAREVAELGLRLVVIVGYILP